MRRWIWCPWHVSRYIIDRLDSTDIPAAKRFYEVEGQADADFCRSRGQAYMPHIYPGFAWSNWNGGEKNAFPRQAGEYLWAQAVGAKKCGVDALYVGMFDEYDEGTSIMKMAEDSSMVPADQYFQTAAADGIWLSSDFYLRLTGALTRMFRGEIEMTEKQPVPYSEGPVYMRTGFEPFMDVPAAFDADGNKMENFSGSVKENMKVQHNGVKSVQLQGKAKGAGAYASCPILGGQDIAITAG